MEWMSLRASTKPARLTAVKAGNLISHARERSPRRPDATSGLLAMTIFWFLVLLLDSRMKLRG